MKCFRLLRPFRLSIFLSTVIISNSIGAEAIWETDTLNIVPQFSEIGFLPGQGFRAEFFAPDGSYGISFSPDLTPGSFGEPVEVASVGGIGDYLDASALGRAKGFYRLEGAYRSEAYHLIAPAFAIEEYETVGIFSGDLVGEVMSKGTVLEYKNEASGGILYDSIGFLFQQYLNPSGESINAFSGFTTDFLQAPASFTADGLVVGIPAGGIALPYGDATRLSSVQDFYGFETDRSVLAATEVAKYNSLPDDDEGGASFAGTKVTLPFLVKKSLNADATDLNGNWGILNLTVGGFRDTDNNQNPIGPVSAFYRLSALSGTIQSTDSNTGNVNITGQRDFEVIEEFMEPYSAFAFESDTIKPEQFPFNLTSDGSIILIDEFDDPIYGAVSPSASMLVATRAFPDELGDEFINNLGFSDQAVIVAVRRDTSASLAGKSFRMKTLGFYVNFMTTPGFEMYRGTPEAGLAFSADGSTAVLSASQDYRAVTVEGDSLADNYVVNVDLDVEIEPDGTILLSADDQFGSTRLVGFAQQGGDAMVFASHYEDDDGFYELGLMILNEE